MRKEGDNAACAPRVIRGKANAHGEQTTSDAESGRAIEKGLRVGKKLSRGTGGNGGKKPMRYRRGDSGQEPEKQQKQRDRGQNSTSTRTKANRQAEGERKWRGEQAERTEGKPSAGKGPPGGDKSQKRDRDSNSANHCISAVATRKRVPTGIKNQKRRGTKAQTEAEDGGKSDARRWAKDTCGGRGKRGLRTGRR